MIRGDDARRILPLALFRARANSPKCRCIYIFSSYASCTHLTTRLTFAATFRSMNPRKHWKALIYGVLTQPLRSAGIPCLLQVHHHADTWCLLTIFSIFHFFSLCHGCFAPRHEGGRIERTAWHRYWYRPRHDILMRWCLCQWQGRDHC